jgi:exopolyphosphatase/pppGpp-phosphohydrolase
VTSLAAILRHLKNDRNAVHGYLITLKELDKLLDFVIMIPEHRVLELLPFNPVGKSFLLTGGMIVREIIARFSAHSFFVSDRTWQYGVLQEIITGRFEI